MEKVLIDCKHEVDDELEDGEILDNEADTKMVKPNEQKRETRVYKDNRVDDVIKKRDFTYYQETMCYKELSICQQNGQHMNQKTWYKEQRTWQQSSQQMWHAPPIKRFDEYRNRPICDKFERQNLKRNADYMTNDMPVHNIYKREQEAVDKNAMFKNNQHYFREQHYVSAAYENGNKNYKNYSENNSRNFTENNFVPKINTRNRNIPSLLDMIIPIPPEFQKANNIMNNNNNNDNSATVPTTSRNNLVIDDTFDRADENHKFNTMQNANIMKNSNNVEEKNIIQKQEEKEEELATPYNYKFTLDSSDDEFDDLIKNGEPVLVQKQPIAMPMRYYNMTRPVTFHQPNHQIMFPNPHEVRFRGPRNPKQIPRYFEQKRKNNRNFF